MSDTEAMSAGELRALVGGIITDVQASIDLDDRTKRIVAIALEDLGRRCEVERRRRLLH